MITIPHKFRNHPIAEDTETLIIGTFNPGVGGNNAEFFYGRVRNFLWPLLASAYNESVDLKKASVEEKKAFINSRKIDFIDLISEIEVEEGQETNYYDHYLDKREKITWTEVIPKIEKLKFLKRVCFTRKSFSGVPKMKLRIDAIRDYCSKKQIYFTQLTTPARFYNSSKQTEWNNFLNHD